MNSDCHTQGRQRMDRYSLPVNTRLVHELQQDELVSNHLEIFLNKTPHAIKANANTKQVMNQDLITLNIYSIFYFVRLYIHVQT